MTSLDTMCVYNNVKIAAKCSHTVIESLIYLLPLAEICFYTVALEAAVAESFCHIIDLIGSSNDHDLTSCLHQTFCHSITKSSCSACYDRFFSFNIK